MIVAYIDAHRGRFGVEPICRVLSEHGVQIAPSTYYAALKCPVSPAELADAYLTDAVVSLFRANRSVYGVRKCWQEMRRAGHRVGRDQVARLMRIAGITGETRSSSAWPVASTRWPSAEAGRRAAPRHMAIARWAVVATTASRSMSRKLTRSAQLSAGSWTTD